MSGRSYLTCVKLNWPISNLRSEPERKYSNRTRTITGSPCFAPPSALALDRAPFESKSPNNPYGGYALFGNEHYPTMRRLRISIRLSVMKTE